MICKCRSCGGSVEWNVGDAEGVCKDCGAAQDIEKSDIRRQAGLLAREGTEESLEKAMALYRSIRGWQDADREYRRCRTQLGRLRWQTESARLKQLEDRHEAATSRRKKIGITVLAAFLLFVAVLTTVSLVRFRQYSKAAEYFTAGEYERSAAAFVEMGDYRDSRSRVYLSAVELYKAGRYEKALPYFVWLDGYIDNGYYLQKCRDKLAVRDAGSQESG